MLEKASHDARIDTHADFCVHHALSDAVVTVCVAFDFASTQVL